MVLKPRGEQPWPGYLQGATGYGQAPCKGAATRRGCSSQGATTHGHGRLRPARRGGRPRPARKGLPFMASPTARRGSDGGGAMRVKEG
ncbi:hypothetical protein GW17_00039626 [Ensete ventricosum]|nr:hypothetical protein GW17_00039626 [Ensete ventricosum]